jgi:GT2 family glycosyltransferase
VAIVVLTHNRVHLLQRCVQDVLLQASDATQEIVVWNNGSTDATAAYLDSLTDARIRIVHSEKNIGQNAYARAFAMTESDYLVELDDDVVDAPPGWDAMLLDAFRRLPNIGFLAADLEDDPHDIAAQHRHHVRPHDYALVEIDGIRVLKGPTGGGCAMTSRAVYEEVGGFRQQAGRAFWLEDQAYIEDIEAVGYEAAILADLKVLHQGGPFYAEVSEEKAAYWRSWEAAQERKAAAKRLLLRIPFLRALNRRHRWFTEPA